MVNHHTIPGFFFFAVAHSLVQIHPQNLTLINGYSGEFHCEGQVSDFLLWNDVVKGPPSLFAGVVGSTNIARGSDAGIGTKYENFFIDSVVGTTIFNMRIENAQFMDDEGMYECTTPAENANPVSLSIEVPTDQISVSCDSCDGASEPTCVCTCIAEGGYPESLTLTWDIDQGSIVSDQLEKIERNGKYDFIGTASVMITQNEAVLQCSVQEYVNQAEIENDFSDQVIQEQILSSTTDCILTLMEAMESPRGDCTVQLNCSCQGLPPINTCTFYNGTTDTVILDKDSCSINHPVPFGTEVTYLCSGSNGINFQQDISDPVSYECLKSKSTTTSSSTNTDANTGEDCTQRSVPALIAVCCVEGVAIIAVIVFFLTLHTLKKIDSGKEEAQRLGTSPQDVLEKTNAEYMDLQETKQRSPNLLNLDVSFENLNLQEPFSGSGLMNYQKAQLILTSKREKIVVKTVSDDSCVKLAKLQGDEVRKLSRLTSNVNVVQFLGRCNSVPNLLCYEFVEGTKLGEYLRENFQPNKIHQYGNTKQKRYHVPEKGSVEILPKLALQIARGMKFLTTQKFIHPGLRSEKVILNVSGQCKLYDFVSEDNAIDTITILWNKSVPYQWMPPEYLFLEKLGPSVDVWSFGVLMWEIFSYGALPYKGKDRNAVEKELRGKENLPLPNNCPGAIWQITLNCWNQSPEKRPSFEHISLQLSHMCNENKEYDEI